MFKPFRKDEGTVQVSRISKKLRYKYLRVLAGAGLPTMAVYGIYDLLFYQQYVLVSIVFYCFLLLVVCLIAIPKMKRGTDFLYHLVVSSFGMMLFYMMVFSGEEGGKALWMFTYPLVTFFLLELKEGLVFNLVTFVSILIVFFNPLRFGWVHEYPSAFAFRFAWVYFCVFMVSFAFAGYRSKYELGIIDRNNKLEEEVRNRKKKEEELRKALEEVKTLSGFLPICSSCKKIRDDEGYWSQIEHYIQDHSNAVFSHSLCPECLHELYPAQAKRIAEGDGKEKDA